MTVDSPLMPDAWTLDDLPPRYRAQAEAQLRPLVAQPALAGLEPRLTEAQWQARVERAAEDLGWFVWHDQDSRRNRAGLPDLLLIRERLVWAELKTATGRLRPAQVEMIARLERAGAEVHMWRPDDWPQVLATLAPKD